MHTETIEAVGHLIDSHLLEAVFDKVIEHGAKFEIVKFEIGRTNDQFSHLNNEGARRGGCGPRGATGRASGSGLLPDRADRCAAARLRPGWLRAGGFLLDHQPPHSGAPGRPVGHGAATAHGHRHRGARRRGHLRPVAGSASWRPGGLRLRGTAVLPDFKERARTGFGFMSSEVSSERRVGSAAARTAEMMRRMRAQNERIVVVAGPVVVHTGAADALAALVRMGYVSALLAGNALAVHDAEHALFGTSLGIHLERGVAAEYGHRNHMRAINLVRRAGGLCAAVQAGLLCRGILYECVHHQVPFVLAGSIRDDGPMPETITDASRAQDLYAQYLEDAALVLCLGTMLHSIGVANMLPSWVPLVAADINPAVVTKIADRGSSQTIGLVTDVGLFLHLLERMLTE